MTSLAVPLALEGFTRLGSATYIYEPPTTSSSSSSPDLIVIAPWLDAVPKHIAKYIDGYKALYPNARLVIITTSISDITYRSQLTNNQRVEPVLKALWALPSNSNILLHIFSHGGSTTVTYILHGYQQRTGNPIPIKAMILDSTPGKTRYERSVAALRMSLPKNPIVRLISATILRILIAAYVLLYISLRKKDIITTMREDLNDDKLSPISADRLYVYSKEDSMVWHEDVEEHARDAKALGWKCTLERFEGSEHAAHMMTDKERYWKAVKKLWDRK